MSKSLIDCCRDLHGLMLRDMEQGRLHGLRVEQDGVDRTEAWFAETERRVADLAQAIAIHEKS
jgi:hypothetical protein